jgi:hypothetical protein
MRFALKIFCRLGLHWFRDWRSGSAAIKGGEGALWFERQCRMCRKWQRKFI